MSPVSDASLRAVGLMRYANPTQLDLDYRAYLRSFLKTDNKHVITQGDVDTLVATWADAYMKAVKGTVLDNGFTQTVVESQLHTIFDKSKGQQIGNVTYPNWGIFQGVADAVMSGTDTATGNPGGTSVGIGNISNVFQWILDPMHLLGIAAILIGGFLLLYGFSRMF